MHVCVDRDLKCYSAGSDHLRKCILAQSKRYPDWRDNILGARCSDHLNCVISPYFRYRRYGYHIDEECIDTVEGYLFIERNIVPMERLHKLQVERGPVARAFGVANVVVTTAGGDVEINLLEDEKAEQIAENLQKRINQIAAEEKHGNDRNEI